MTMIYMYALMDMQYYIYSISSMCSIIEGIYHAVIKLLKFLHPCMHVDAENT